MKWSWKLGRILGIDLRMHVTFLLLIAWVAFIAYQAEGTVRAAVNGVLFILAIFAAVVLHEFGHALTARRFGVPTREITLLPIGGVAQLERMPREPRQELLIAVAGPLVTIALIVLFWGLARATGAPLDPNVLLFSGAPFVTRFMWVNIFIAAFNLLPAFPMDGGRILRSSLAMKMDYLRATRVAARIGQGFAILFGLYGLFGPAPNLLLVIIALFVWMGAAGEAAYAEMHHAFAGIPVSAVMIRDMHTLGPDDPLGLAVQHVLAGFQQDFPVVEGGRVVGVLTRSDLVAALARQGTNGRVGDVMDRDFAVADPQEPLNEAFARLQACRCRSMPVVLDDSLLGVLTAENVGEFLMFRDALRGGRR